MEASAHSLSAPAIWTLAVRPKTLWAAVAPVIVGSALAWREDVFHWPAGMAALIGALLLQITANFANDLHDFERGTDSHDRIGPLRVTQAGLVSTRQMRAALAVVIGLAVVPGLYLVIRGGWPILIVGLAGIVSAILYTGGGIAYGYRGWGELFVFLFFGLAAVAGTYYVHALTVHPLAFWLAVPMGCLAVAILVVNNLRDIDTDRKAGKRTLAVRLGRSGGRLEYILMIVVACAIPILLVIRSDSRWGVLLASASLLGAIPILRTIFGSTEGPALNNALAQTARLQLLYAILLSIGLNL
ncbi:MAG: 1,4-dihydroxy-2-naphthoate polyprenyltransferase [Candidatus Zixiibacteriota bacterium]